MSLLRWQPRCQTAPCVTSRPAPSGPDPDPFRFRIDRDPNPHVGFGYGEHFCLGSHLARRSQRALFGELARRLEHVESAGEPEWIQSSFVVGLKRLPIRYRIARGA